MKMDIHSHYLKTELYDLIKNQSNIFEFLQAGSLDGLWYWDLEKPTNEWMSPRFWTILGFDPNEKKHLASEWQDLISSEDLQLAFENFNKHCANPDYPYDQVVRYNHKDGSTVWVRCRGIVIRDQTGKPIRMLGAHTDITTLKKTEIKLEEKNRELKSLNEELKKALSEIRTLRGLLPICSHCKSIRDDKGLWTRIEAYISDHTNAKFSHGLCPECLKEFYPDEADDIIKELNSMSEK